MERAASSDKIMVLIALAGFIQKPRAIATYIDRPLDTRSTCCRKLLPTTMVINHCFDLVEWIKYSTVDVWYVQLKIQRNTK